VAVTGELRHRLRVNPILCNGFGYCAEIVPELIALDDWGFPILNPRPFDEEHLLHLAERAVATCPRLALLLEDVPLEAG
jgi:ferredoxin